MLSRYSIQSTSDQEDYRNYATIAANACAGLTPEQAAVWSYPQRDGDEEETVYNMVNALLLRIHQSGHLPQLSAERRPLVKEGVDYYKRIRQNIRRSVPTWPMGLADSLDYWLATALKTEDKVYLAVWRRGGDESVCEIPLDKLIPAGEKAVVHLAYPENALAENVEYSVTEQTLTVRYQKAVMARIFEIVAE